MKNVEIEKKWRVKELPEDLGKYEMIDMEQAYLNEHPTVRIRRENDEYVLTYKGISDNDISHPEYNLPLTREAFEHMLPKHDGRIIKKKRYVIPLSVSGSPCASTQDTGSSSAPDQHTSSSMPDQDTSSSASDQATSSSCGSASATHPLKAELDIFDEPFAPLMVVEVEFPSMEAAQSFTPPDWFGEEVTHDIRFKNAVMAIDPDFDPHAML